MQIVFEQFIVRIGMTKQTCCMALQHIKETSSYLKISTESTEKLDKATKAADQ
jgi:hypothetical protein